MTKSGEVQKKGKAFNQFGDEITEGVKEKEMELVQILVTREEIDEIIEHQHEKFSKNDLTRQGQFLMALAFVQSAKVLLAVTSKEKAKEAMAKAIYDFAYTETRAAAEKRGNPKDLISYLKYEKEGLGNVPFIPPPEVLELTKTRARYGIQHCPFANSVRKLAEMFPDYVDQDVLDVVASRCSTLDSGRANGWNPDMKFKRTHYLLDDLIGRPPSKGCYFEIEVSEE
jgi:hypothetical protein